MGHIVRDATGSDCSSQSSQFSVLISVVLILLFEFLSIASSSWSRSSPSDGAAVSAWSESRSLFEPSLLAVDGMSPLWMFYLIIPVLVGFLVAEYKSDILKLIRSQFSNENDEESATRSELDLLPEERKALQGNYDAVIFVPSARGNFEQRAAIRGTWLGAINSNSSLTEKVLLKFVVGSDPCSIHPDDRLNPFSCENWNVDLPEKKDEVVAIEETESTTEVDFGRQIYGIQSIPFTVHYPIILSKLGVFREAVQSGANVRLLEASTQREVVGAIFTKDTPGVLVGNFRYRAVEPYYLPKGFEGIIVGDSLNGGNSHLSVSKWNRKLATRMNNSSNIIQFFQNDPLPDGHYEDVRKWNSIHVHIVSFIYSIEELNNLKAHIRARDERAEIWKQNMSDESKSLAEEMEKHGDIKVVDLIDVYRNVPLKFLRFSEWVSSALKFDFLVKTDDDCYLDIFRILNLLHTFEGATKTWLGRFRNNWMVEKHGKWTEKDYPSVVYPKFACGSGYALTSDLVIWIARNSKSLKPYQGEDVSLGIWMAAVAPTYVDEPLWQCAKDCLSNMYSMPELRHDELHRIWNDLVTCGDPCGCS